MQTTVVRGHFQTPKSSKTSPSRRAHLNFHLRPSWFFGLAGRGLNGDLMVIYGLQCFSIRKIMENWSVELCLTASCRRVQHFSISLVAYEPNGWHLILMAKWRNCPKNRRYRCKSSKLKTGMHTAWLSGGSGVGMLTAMVDGKRHPERIWWVYCTICRIFQKHSSHGYPFQKHKQPFLYSLLSALFTSLLSSVLYSLHFSTVLSSLLKSSLQISLRLLLYSFNYSTYTLFKPSLSISRKLGSFSSKLLLAKLLRHDSSQPNTNHPITRFPGLSLQSDFRMIRCNLLSRHLLSSYISPSISSA